MNMRLSNFITISSKRGNEASSGPRRVSPSINSRCAPIGFGRGIVESRPDPTQDDPALKQQNSARCPMKKLLVAKRQFL
jgi:hypothetical protein